MDSTAIKEIELNSALKAINQNQAVNNFVALPEKASLVSLEQFKSSPDFFRGHFNTPHIDEFCKYLNESGTTSTAVFIDTDAMEAKAIIDLGTGSDPEWGKHRANLTLKNAPAYNALLQLNDKSTAQQDFIDFVEDWEPHINFIDAEGKTLPFRQTLQTLRRLTVNANASKEQTAGNFTASRSAMENIEIKAGTDALPYGFVFECEPHDTFATQQFNCQMRAITDDKGVKLKYRVGQLDIKKQSIGAELSAKIQAQIKIDGALIYLGSMSY